jgi:hypothetical protein
MTPYGIFVIVITVAYIIYYGYNIHKDIYGKKVDSSSAEEVYHIHTNIEEVIATPVREVDGGFSLGSNIINTIEDRLDGNDKTKINIVDRLNDNFEPAESYSEGGLNDEQLALFMLNNNSTKNLSKSSIGIKYAII